MRDVAWKNLISTVFYDKFVTPCVAGRKLIIISETGEVKPCEILQDRSMGNLKDYDYNLKKLMNNHETKITQKWIVSTKCKCSFECALAANVTWNFSQYPLLLVNAYKNIGKGWKDSNKTLNYKSKKVIEIHSK